MGDLIISYAHCHEVDACVVLPLQEGGAVAQVSLVFAGIGWSRGVILGLSPGSGRQAKLLVAC